MRIFRIFIFSFSLALPLSSSAQLEGLTNLLGLSGLGSTGDAVLGIPVLDPSLLTENLSSGGGLLVTFLEPQKALGPILGLGSGVLGAVSPALNVLFSSPAELPTFFFLDGGTLLSSGLGGLPGIPLINAPLPGLGN